MGKSSTHKSDFTKNETPDLNYLKSFSETSEFVSLFLSHDLFPLGYVFMYISFMPLDEKWNFKQKISARVNQNKFNGHKKIMSCESGFKIRPTKNIFRKQ